VRIERDASAPSKTTRKNAAMLANSPMVLVNAYGNVNRRFKYSHLSALSKPASLGE
jgi:hypothetical protein